MGSSVIVGDQGALDRRADLPVEPDGSVEGEQALKDARPQSGGDPAAVAFQAELVLECPDDRLDALPQPVREAPGSLLVLAGRRSSSRRACSRSPYSLGLARPNPVTVPSQVTISSSLDPQYQREWLGQYP